MDEAALIPTIQYAMLTTLVLMWVIRAIEWLELTGVTATLVALIVVFEMGFAYENVKEAIRY